jgi:membrane protein implicated in regulation of membrane protease activity
MESIYLISLIVGGFFVALSVLGGGDADSDADFDAGADFDADFHVDLDADFDADGDIHGDLGGLASAHAGDIGVVDLLSIRTLFLFAAFFGLTGVLLGYAGTGEPVTGVLSAVTGLTIGMGGNYIIKKFAYQSVSSEVTSQSIRGKTGRVILPFGSEDTGKILIEAKGKRLQLIARSLDDDPAETFGQGDEVVIVRVNGRVAEVVKPT